MSFQYQSVGVNRTAKNVKTVVYLSICKDSAVKSSESFFDYGTNNSFKHFFLSGVGAKDFVEGVRLLGLFTQSTICHLHCLIFWLTAKYSWLSSLAFIAV